MPIEPSPRFHSRIRVKSQILEQSLNSCGYEGSVLIFLVYFLPDTEISYSKTGNRYASNGVGVRVTSRVTSFFQTIITTITMLLSKYSSYSVSGFDFPRGPGAYAPRFCCGPLDSSV